MARIKSAWEIALEKTQDITIDENKYHADTLEKEGKTLVGSYLNNNEESIDNVKEKLSKYNNDDLKHVKTGIFNTIFLNISLPVDEYYEMRFLRICDLVSVSTNNDNNAMLLMSQIGEFFKQYTECKKDFISRMEAQIRQAMETNPESINKQQYTQLIEQNLKKMDSQYSEALNNTKESLKEILK